jgi:N-acetylmuramoyl-L-alanine amidase
MGSTGAEVQLQGWAPVPRVRRPLAAALVIDNSVAEAALSLTRNDRTPTILRELAFLVRSMSASDGSVAGDSATCQVAMPHAEPVADAVPATS